MDNNEVTEVAKKDGFVSTEKGAMAAKHIADVFESFPVAIPTQEEVE